MCVVLDKGGGEAQRPASLLVSVFFKTLPNLPSISEARFANPHEAHTTGGQEAALNAPKGISECKSLSLIFVFSFWFEREDFGCRFQWRGVDSGAFGEGQILPQLRNSLRSRQLLCLLWCQACSLSACLSKRAAFLVLVRACMQARLVCGSPLAVIRL